MSQRVNHRLIHIANSEQFSQLTGQPAPPSPVSAQVYTQYGYPWFELYDERKPHLSPGEKLGDVTSIREQDLEKDLPARPEDKPVEIGERQIKKLEGRSFHVGEALKGKEQARPTLTLDCSLRQS